MMDREKALKKIKKCMALGQSSEPAEAAAAMRQAQKLMDMYGINDSDVEFSTIGEKSTSAGRTNETPPGWLSHLAAIVSSAFGVNNYYQPTFASRSQYVFIGVDPAQEIAAYAFTVLRRQLTASRAAYYKSLRGKRVNRIRRADAYAVGWVNAVNKTVRNFAKPVPAAVGNYMKAQHTNLVEFTPRGKLNNKDSKDAVAGFIDGSDVTLHHGVDGSEQAKIGAAQ